MKRISKRWCHSKHVRDNEYDFKVEDYNQSHREEYIRKNTFDILMPEDVVKNTSVISIAGTNCVVIENFKRIVEYSSERIVIQTMQNKVIVTGIRLCIVYYYDIEMQIKGCITEISFL